MTVQTSHAAPRRHGARVPVSWHAAFSALLGAIMVLGQNLLHLPFPVHVALFVLAVAGMLGIGLAITARGGVRSFRPFTIPRLLFGLAMLAPMALAPRILDDAPWGVRLSVSLGVAMYAFVVLRWDERYEQKRGRPAPSDSPKGQPTPPEPPSES